MLRKQLKKGLPRRRIYLLAGAAALGLFIFLRFFLWLAGEIPYWGEEPIEIVNTALNEVKMGLSYSYSMEAVEEVDGQRRVLAVLEGRKSGSEAQISGDLPFINGSIELVRKSNQLYRKDALEDRWVKVPLVNLEDLETLMVEINPLSIFSFLDNTAVEYAGKGKVDGRRCRIYEAMSRGENMWLTFIWQDYNYRIWVDQKEGYLKQGEITAEHRDDSTHRLIVTVKIKDYNQPLTIEAPVQN
ncbi:MAG: hypothetical protein AAGU12_11435 [Clostridiales bacterium]